MDNKTASLKARENDSFLSLAADAIKIKYVSFTFRFLTFLKKLL